MNTKKLLTLVVALAVVIGIVVLSEKLGKREGNGKATEFLSSFTADNCSAFQIVEKQDTVKIRRKGDIWVVAAANADAGPAAGLSGGDAQPEAQAKSAKEYPADSASVATVLEKLSGMKRTDLISQNASKQEVFEVDSAHGILVEVWDRKAKSFGAFRIGKSGPDWSSHYVRMVGSDDVFSVGGSIKYSFFTDKKRWRDKTVTSFDKAKAKSLALAKKGGITIKLEKSTDTTGGETWAMTAPVKQDAKKETVDKVMNALSAFRTTDWEESDTVTDASMGFEDPDLVATVVLENGDTREIIVGNEKPNESKFWVKAREKDPVFLVADYTIRDIDVSLDDLKAAVEVAPSTEPVEN